MSSALFASQLMPTPKWKLVVDVGSAPPKPDDAKATDKRVQDVLKLLAEHTPTHRNSPYSPYLPGFTSLRLLMLKRNRSNDDDDLLSTMLASYSSYLASGRERGEIAWMMARDYMVFTQPSNQLSSALAPSLPPFQSQQNHQLASQQLVQQVLQPQLGQLQPGANQIQNQFHQQQMQQIEVLQHAASLQSGTSPVPLGPGLNPGFMGVAGAMGTSSLSALGHLAPRAGPNASNSIAALTQLAQQQHNTLGNNSLFPSSLSQSKGQQEK